MQNLQLSPHFNLREFRCQKDYKDCPYCGGSIRGRNIAVYQAEVYRLEILRWAMGDYYQNEVEVIIGSGDRCSERNAEVSHCKPPSFSKHWDGCAIDIFARIKETKEPAEMLRLYAYATRLWPEPDMEYYDEHIHITLART